MKSDEIRSRFLEYFAENGHQVVRSSSLIPQRDPTLLFTNAGMNQFKDVFLGREKRDYNRAATSQKCVRAGGKHNDLENVGYTNRHLTFFEMLGNFSFSDYFKKEAIVYAWDLLTKGFELPQDRLHATVYLEDDEAHGLWLGETSLPEARLTRLGKADNFWAMGETGPCGPCSEIYIDTELEGCGRDECAPGCECPRFVEIWNLVFMQYDRDGEGVLHDLPSPSIDTGMGLERLSMVLQGTDDVYQTDLLLPIMQCAADKAGCSLGDSEESDVALRVIADHLRSSVFLLSDGVLPANDGRGYVLRRIIRRALRFGKRVGFEGPFLNQFADFVIERMAAPYPDLTESAAHIVRVIHSEEERFDKALSYSGRIFEEIVDGLGEGAGRLISGADAFRLYDTYGLPLDTLRDMAEVRGVGVDLDGYESFLEASKKKARQSWKGRVPDEAEAIYRQIQTDESSEFVGYATTEVASATIVAILRDKVAVESLQAGEEGEVVLSSTPFYPEGGGQVGDRGTLATASARGIVEDTQAPVPGLIVHRLVVGEGTFRKGEGVSAAVSASRRRAIASNHSATHLLHAALRQVLGEHVKQAGSLVTNERLRFDFAHYAKLEIEEQNRVETLVNEQIAMNTRVESDVVSMDEALRRGALAFFGDKYGDEVRVIRMGEFSTELCGGTHVASTGDIGYFRLEAAGSVASGVRRAEAITGDVAVVRALNDHRLLEELAGHLNVPTASLREHVDAIRSDLKAAKREIADLRLKLVSGNADDSDDGATQDVDGIKLISRHVAGLDGAGLRALADQLRSRLGSGVVVLGTVSDSGKATLLVSVTPDMTERVNAGVTVRALAKTIGGSGGGRADMAQAGGPDGTRLDEALGQAAEAVRAQLG